MALKTALRKKILALALAGLASFGLTACGGAGSGNGTIIYANHQNGDAFTDSLQAAFKQQADSAGWQVEYLDGKGDGNLQIDQIAEVIEKKPSAIVLIPVDGVSIVPTVKQANEAGIPIISVNRYAEGGESFKAYSDDLEAGRLQAEFMAKNLPQNAKVVYLKGTSGQKSADQRWESFQKNCLERRKDIELLAMADAQWSTAEAMKDMSLWLEMFPKIDGVVCGNDSMAIGAIAALRSAGRLQGVFISAVDATEPGLKAVAAGDLSQTVKQDAEGQAKATFELVKASLQGGTPADIEVPYTSITRENVAQYLK